MLLAGARRALDAVLRAGASSTATRRCMGRTHGVHAEPTTFGLKLLGWWCELRRGRERLAERARRRRRRQALRRRRRLRQRRPARRGAGAGARSAWASSPSPRRSSPRDRHAALLRRSPILGAVARPLRDRDPPPAAQRGARGGRAVRRRPEGLVGDAAQAQPDHVRAHLRPGARAARQRRRRPRERAAVARARHLALLRRARRAARLDDRPRLPARPLRLGDRGARGLPGADAPQHRRRRTA